MDAWLGLLAFGMTLVVVLVTVRLGTRRVPVVVPDTRQASAFRERSRNAAYVSFRDPDAPGSGRRPRAPSSTPL